MAANDRHDLELAFPMPVAERNIHNFSSEFHERRYTFRCMLVTSFGTLFFVAASALLCFSQDPLPIVRSNWQPSVQKVRGTDHGETGPARQVIIDDTLGPRKAREFRTDHPDNPSDQTPDGRRAMMEKNEQEANAPQAKDTPGFIYSATVRNDGSKTVKVIYWEYRFAEIARPTNVVRRQFLCSVDLKKGANIELIAFSTLGPTDVIDANSLARL